MTDEDIDAPFDIERRGAKAGLNPMFGEWRHRFEFPPVPHRDTRGEIRRAFHEKVRAELTNQFLYWNDVSVTITLHLDLQTTLETSENADLDNYAKCILDALKGPGGIILDDSQVQALAISWIDAPNTYFEVEVRASPDDFILKPVKFYEMPDGLFYPEPSQFWSPEGPEDVKPLDQFVGLAILEMMTGEKARMRRVLRANGFTRTQAFQRARPHETLLRGFHATRVVESGFYRVAIATWREELEEWKCAEPAHGLMLDAMKEERRKAYDALTDAIASAGPDAYR